MIAECFATKKPLDVPGVLVASHGPFSWGKDSHQAVFNAVVLEELARMALFTIQINPEIQSIPQSLLEKRYMRKHGKDATYGQIM